MAEHLIIDATTGDTSTRPVTAEEQAERDAAAEERAARDQIEAFEDTNRTAIEDKAVQALQANADFLAFASPTNVQTLAQVKTLTRECSAVIRLLLRKLDTTDGT